MTFYQCLGQRIGIKETVWHNYHRTHVLFFLFIYTYTPTPYNVPPKPY